jgi:hypothetical protein
MTANKESEMTTLEAEVWSLNQGIRWMHKVYLKMNCRMMVDDMNNIKANHSEYGSIIQNYKILLSNYNGFIIVFTKRQTNGRVHAFARAVLSHNSHNIFLYNY